MRRDLYSIAHEVAELVEHKANGYGDVSRVSTCLYVLYAGKPIPTGALDDLLLMVRVLDKLARLAHGAGQPDPGGESPWLDIAGYALLALQRKGQRCELEGGDHGH